jgi:hypothetical protein
MIHVFMAVQCQFAAETFAVLHVVCKHHKLIHSSQALIKDGNLSGILGAPISPPLPVCYLFPSSHPSPPLPPLPLLLLLFSGGPGYNPEQIYEITCVRR